MKYYGVVYDVGLRFTGAELSVEPFDADLVRYDMRVIAEQLHANAVRIEGEPLERLEVATRAAHAAGLSVYFNPWKMNAGIEETRAYVAEAAVVAEKLRVEGVDIVFVAGCELTIFSNGFFPGSSVMERGAWLGSQLGAEQSLSTSGGYPTSLQEKSEELNVALRGFAEAVRATFSGPLTYSAGTWEAVDWSLFDIVGIDYYRRQESDEEYIDGLAAHRREGKPLAVMEVGCCAYDGAAAAGDGGFTILQGVEPDGSGIWRDGRPPERDEQEQADYIATQLELLAGSDVHAVFVYVFSFPSYRAGDGVKDLDIACFSLVKTFAADDERTQQMPPWAPKKAFHRAGEFFKHHARSLS